MVAEDSALRGSADDFGFYVDFSDMNGMDRLRRKKHTVERGARDALPLGPHCTLSEVEVRLAFEPVVLGSEDESDPAESLDAIVFVVKLGLHLTAWGLNSQDTEELMLRCAEVLPVAC